MRADGRARGGPTLEAYLEEAQSPMRHTRVRGFPRAMAGASRRHNLPPVALARTPFPPGPGKGVLGACGNPGAKGCGSIWAWKASRPTPSLPGREGP